MQTVCFCSKIFNKILYDALNPINVGVTSVVRATDDFGTVDLVRRKVSLNGL